MLAFPILLLLAVVGTGSATAKPSPHARNSDSSEVLGLPIDAKINLNRLSNVVAADVARAAHFKGHGQKKRDSRHRGKRQSVAISATNTAVDFTTKVKFGEPATEYTLLLDSGSSNTFVGLRNKYSPSGASNATGKSVSVTYGSGSFSGTEYTDKVDLGNGLVINSQRIAGVTHSSGFDGTFDGILGIGPTDLTQGTVSGSSEEIPTVLDNLFSQKTIGAKVLGLSLPPFSSGSGSAGSISFGGAESSKYNGKLVYTDITKTDPAKDYWGVDQSIQYGDTTILKSSAGIIDSGSTMILLATDAYNAYKQATGATLDDKTKMLKLPKDQQSKLQPLKFIIGGVDYTLNANAQIFPRSLNEALGGDNDSVYLVVGDLGSNSGEGLDFINGYAFMERFYTVYDATNSKIGLATTEHTEAQSN